MMIGLMLGLLISVAITMEEAQKNIQKVEDYYILKCKLKESGIVEIGGGFNINISYRGNFT